MVTVAGHAQTGPNADAPASNGSAAPDATGNTPPKPVKKIPQTFTTAENLAARTPGPLGAPPTLSERLDQALPKWLQVHGEFRERFEGYNESAFKPNTSDDYLLQRERIDLTISPTSWLRFTGQMQDARVFEKSPAIPPYQNTWDIRQAYVELGREGNGFGLRAGRQELDFGNGRLIGKSWWTNVSRSFDAIRGSWQNSVVRVDVFASSVVIIRDGVIDHHNQGNNLHGIYGTYKNLIPNSQLETYGFWHVQNGATLKTGKLGHLDQYTWGFRYLGTLPANFDYRTEMAIQLGKLGPANINSWMGHWTGGYSIPRAILQPRVFVEYDYGSGDGNQKNLNSYHTFDPIYPSTHDKLGVADLFGWRNIRDLRFGAEFHGTKKLTFASSFHDFWLANRFDSLYPTRGSVIAKSATGTAGTHVGEELDVQGIYLLTKQLRFSAGYGHLWEGEFLKITTKGKNYNAPYVILDYTF